VVDLTVPSNPKVDKRDSNTKALKEGSKKLTLKSPHKIIFAGVL
jgi:hypothetical protein